MGILLVLRGCIYFSVGTVYILQPRLIARLSLSWSAGNPADLILPTALLPGLQCCSIHTDLCWMHVCNRQPGSFILSLSRQNVMPAASLVDHKCGYAAGVSSWPPLLMQVIF